MRRARPSFQFLRNCLLIVLLATIVALQPVLLLPAWAGEAVDLEMITRIRQEGFRNSKVMETASELMDRIGPRLTGSPNIKKANEWTRDQLAKWGLVNARLESWGPFGRGWSNEFTSVRMLTPYPAPLIALPKAWTPGTQGPLRAKAVKVRLQAKEDLEKQKGKLAGKIVLIADMREVRPHAEAELRRYDDKALEEIARFQIGPARPPFDREEFFRRREFQNVLNKFLAEEKALAAIEPGRGDGGTVFVAAGGPYRKGEPTGMPSLVMAVEHYGRIARLLDRNVDVELELDIRNEFYDGDEMAYNTVAEIPGTDKKDEVVMLGAHIDSWHGGTGATDNGAGVAVTMEAVRILQALGVKLRRTVRVGLWSGEEQGLLGSRAYVSQHFASRPEPKDAAERGAPDMLRRDQGPLTFKPEHAKISAYFNYDNGTGKIRGVYCQENAAVRPIFEAWIEPLKDLGITTVSLRNTSGTDHMSFDAVGVPGFQFIQDEVEYSTRTHHSNMDVYERLQREDLMQASVVMAAFVYHAAMRDQMLPRKPLPKGEPPRPEQPKREAPRPTSR